MACLANIYQQGAVFTCRKIVSPSFNYALSLNYSRLLETCVNWLVDFVNGVNLESLNVFLFPKCWRYGLKLAREGKGDCPWWTLGGKKNSLLVKLNTKINNTMSYRWLDIWCSKLIKCGVKMWHINPELKHFTQACRHRSGSALETPTSNHIHFPPPLTERLFILTYAFLHSSAATLANIKQRAKISNAHTLNVSSPWHMEASPSNLCGQAEPLFFFSSLTQ